MAFISVEFYSECLKRCVGFKVILPNDMQGTENGTPRKTLYLLHGYGNRNSEWVWNSNIVELAEKYRLCVVLPSGENSFYLDGAAVFGTFRQAFCPVFGPDCAGSNENAGQWGKRHSQPGILQADVR